MAVDSRQVAGVHVRVGVGGVTISSVYRWLSPIYKTPMARSEIGSESHCALRSAVHSVHIACILHGNFFCIYPGGQHWLCASAHHRCTYAGTSWLHEPRVAA